MSSDKLHEENHKIQMLDSQESKPQMFGRQARSKGGVEEWA